MPKGNVMPLRVASAVVLALLLSGCSKQAATADAEKVVNDMVKAIREIAPVADSVKDAATAGAAMEKFIAIENQMGAIAERAAKIHMPEKSRKVALDAKLKKEWEVIDTLTATVREKIRGNQQAAMNIGVVLFDLRKRSEIVWEGQKEAEE